jgi:hypothetical protein
MTTPRNEKRRFNEKFEQHSVVQQTDFNTADDHNTSFVEDLECAEMDSRQHLNILRTVKTKNNKCQIWLSFLLFFVFSGTGKEFRC